MAAPPTIVFIRHGETDWNVVGRLQGHTDIPLNENGREQARRNGRIVAEKVPEAAAYDYVASPLLRARETMEIVRETLRLDRAGYRVDDRLRELGYGAWEGRTLEELRTSDPARFHQRETDKWDFLPPAGESYALLWQRVAAWFATVAGDTVVVAHGGVGRVLWGHFAGIAPEVIVTTHFPQDQVMVWRDEKIEWL
jgi:probable phosphoglycerate mutase